MRTFAMASILLTTLVLGTDAASAAPWCTEAVKGGGTNCGFIPSSSAWPAPRATVGSAGRTSSKIPIGPAARCNGAIAAAIKDLSGREPYASSSGRCRCHRRNPDLVGAAPPLRPDIIFGKDNIISLSGSRVVHHSKTGALKTDMGQKRWSGGGASGAECPQCLQHRNLPKPPALTTCENPIFRLTSR